VFRRLAISAAMMAAGAGLFVASVPAAAQTREDDARFEAAQRRLDSELAIFKTEFERYRRAQSAEPQASQPGERYDDPRVYGDDVRDRDRDEESRAEDPRASDEPPPPYPDDRGYEPPR
jgi:hypothetical protein